MKNTLYHKNAKYKYNIISVNKVFSCVGLYIEIMRAIFLVTPIILTKSASLG